VKANLFGLASPIYVSACFNRVANKCFDTASNLFPIQLHFVRKERIGIAQISAGELLTRCLRAVAVKKNHDAFVRSLCASNRQQDEKRE
jgi:hypothetical protein